MDIHIFPCQIPGSSHWFRGQQWLSKGSRQSLGFSLFLPITYSGMASLDPDYEVAKISLVFGVEDTGILSLPSSGPQSSSPSDAMSPVPSSLL